MNRPLVILAALFALPACHAAKSTPGPSSSLTEPGPAVTALQSTDATNAIDAGLASPRFRTVDDFSLPAITRGEDFVLSDALGESDGQWVALHFLLKTDCPLCLTYTMRFHESREQLPGVSGGPGVRHVFIKPDDPRIAARWVKTARVFAKDLPTIHRDPGASLAKKLDVRFGHRFHGETVHYPCLVLIDPQGRERYRYTGTSTFDRATVAKLAEVYRSLSAKP